MRILTGAYEQSLAAAASSGGAGGSARTPITMTYAEQVKEMTLHGWRLQMLGLELRQNVLIAPEDRERLEQGLVGTGAEEDTAVRGFELKDEHECALLEEGDEIM